VERLPTISRTRDVLLVVSLIRKSESITGLRRPDRERDKVMEDRLMLKRLSEEPKMDLDTTLLLRPNQENKIEDKNVQILIVLFLIIFEIYFGRILFIMGNDQPKARPPTPDEIRASIRKEVQKAIRENDREKMRIDV
jgi:hypothetical protein